MTFKILVSDPIFEEGIQLLEKKKYQVKKAWNIPKSELPKIIGEYDALIVRSATKVNSELLSNAKKLKVIGRAGDGLDNVDIEYARKLGIVVVNTPHVASTSVAELAVGYLLALSRNIVTGTTTLREGKWLKEELMGNEINGKTLGIVGCGNIGREVRKLALALGMNVLTVDVCVSKEFVPLDYMLPKADFVSIHVPLTPHTRHFISKKEIEKMKDGVMLINCSRGGVVDEEALYEALVKGKVKSAALDVFAQEPAGNNRLLSLANVIATPHIGAQTWEAQSRTSLRIAEKIIAELEELSS